MQAFFPSVSRLNAGRVCDRTVCFSAAGAACRPAMAHAGARRQTACVRDVGNRVLIWIPHMLLIRALRSPGDLTGYKK
eukprot:4737256-Prymnesium_polylepis.1